MSRKSLFSIVMVALMALSMRALAQDATQEPGAITVSRTEPTQFTNGQNGILSIFGTNFTEDTTVRLVGVGLLQVTFINSGALTAALSSDIPTGQYTIEVSSPSGGTVASPNTLTVVAPAAPLPTAAPPTAVPTAIPTSEPATPVPGQPSLIVRDFAAVPSVVAPGGPVGLTFVVLNQGNRTAEGVSVSLDSGGKFFPAAGQAGVALPDMPPGSSVQVTLNAVAARDAAEGPTNIPITMAYRDFEGKTFTTKADLAVGIAAFSEIAQVTMVRYSLEPQVAAPGSPITVTVTVTNSGNTKAERVLLRVTGDKSILLAGSQGDSFPIGDLDAGQSITVDLPLVVNPAAESGPQSQPVTISFAQNGTAKDTTTSMTIQVARVAKPEALILLADYSTGDGTETLRPGARFTLSMTLQNVGSADALEALVTFGSVDSTPQSTGGDSSGGGVNTSGGSSSSSSGDAFAPLGGGDTVFLGTVAPGDTVPVEQNFIVNSTVTSGIYSLPITVRYQKSDGSAAQQSLRASVIVIAPLRVQTSLASPLPSTTNVGEPLPVTLKILNNSTNAFNVTAAEVTAENAEVAEGATSELSPIKADDDGNVNATILPMSDGEYTVTFTLTYTDDLNREQTLVRTFTGQAVSPPPPPDMPPDMPSEPVAAEEEENLLGRLLLGFLGLGG